jgi:hypothetical protein
MIAEIVRGFNNPIFTTSVEDRGVLEIIELKYIDIKLELRLLKQHNGETIIYIEAFSRGHHVRENPHHRIGLQPAKVGEPGAKKGDGAKFLALTVLYCSEHNQIKKWSLTPSGWWRLNMSPCGNLFNACREVGEGKVEIDPENFVVWAHHVTRTFSVRAVNSAIEAPAPQRPICRHNWVYNHGHPQWGIEYRCSHCGQTKVVKN